jgi:hypothetical protein
MAHYCGTCGSKLVSQKVKTGEEPTGTRNRISYKVFIVTTISRYICPNGCALKYVKSYK